MGRGGEVCDDAGDKGQAREGKADDGEVLEVPAVRFVYGIGIIMEPFERVYKGGETK